MQGHVTILGFTPNIEAMIASGGRISTMDGTADEIFAEANMENGEYKEDTFARYFYDSVKSKLDESSTIVQERMLADYNTENAVTKYTTRYQDLLDMDSSN